MTAITDHFQLPLRPTKFDAAFTGAGAVNGIETWQLTDTNGNVYVQKCEVKNE
jgi:hypothetical protein